MSGPTPRSVPRPGLTLALLAFAQFMTAVDFDIVFVALPQIGRDLEFSEQSLQTVVSAYTVVLGGFLLLGGRAADRLGARRTFFAGLAVFGLSSLAAGLAEGPTALVLARAVQGLGAALLTPSTLKLVTTHFAEGAARNKALAIWGAAGASGAAVGALGGGVLTSLLGWEWVFFVNVPLMVIALASAPALLGKDAATGPGGFDLPGAVLATAGFTLVVLGLVSGPEIGWLTVRGLAAVVLGVVLVGLFVLVESRTLDPLLPLSIFRNRNVVAATTGAFLFMGTVGTQYHLFTTYLQTVLGYTPLTAGFAFLPLSVCSLLASMKLVPLLLGRLGIRSTLVIGMTGVTVSMVVLALGMSVDGSYWAVLPGVLLWGTSAGLAFPALFVSVSTGVALERQGIASALASTAQYLGSAVGLAALVAVATAGVGPDATSDSIVAGLRLAGLVAAALTLAGAVLAAIVLRPRTETAVPKAQTENA